MNGSREERHRGRGHGGGDLGDGPIAVISDVHANRWALEAVLEDLQRVGVEHVVNLGDSLFGPLDPAGTAALLQGLDLLSVRGNQDRTILDPGPEDRWSPTLQFVRKALDAKDLAWLEGHRPHPVLLDRGLLLCHGSPVRDDEYLAERVTERGLEVKSPEELHTELGSIEGEVILCGHSHVPRVLSMPAGRLVVNPGSVGLPAYAEDLPYPHVLEAGSPHARYALLFPKRKGRWRIIQVAVSYDWERAAREALSRGRPDWAEWIRSGRAAP
jgi:predicted phosphodiesterase